MTIRLKKLLIGTFNMKYIITESKLDQVIYDYLDELFAAENGNTEIHKLEVFSTQPENRNEPLEGQYDFVNDDYYDDNKIIYKNCK